MQIWGEIEWANEMHTQFVSTYDESQRWTENVDGLSLMYIKFRILNLI